MSATLLGIAWRAKLGSANRKIVLMRLVDAADDDGANIYPSIRRVALETELSERTIQTTLKSFVELRLVEVVSHKGGGRGQPTRYKLNLEVLASLCPPKEKGADIVAPFIGTKGERIAAPFTDSEPKNGEATVAPFTDGKGADMVAPFAIERVQTEHRKGANDDIKGAKLLRPTPHVPLIDYTPQEESIFRPSKAELDQGFEEFYRQYPRRKKPDAAKHAFVKIVRSGNATMAELIAGAVRFAAERHDENPKYTPYPASWLNSGSWRDEPDRTPPITQPRPSQSKASLFNLAMGERS